MDIDKILDLLEIKSLRKELSSTRGKIKTLQQEIVSLEKEKRKKNLTLKFKETRMKKEIGEEKDFNRSTKKKFPNENLREAEFIVRSAEDPDISEVREDISIINENIYNKKVEVEIELKYYEELTLNYQLAINLIKHLGE